MSWTFLYNAPDKRQVVEKCTKNQGHHRCVLKAVHGNNLWTVWHDTVKEVKEIVLFKLGKDNGSWGYKGIPESAGPLFYDCPESFLKEVSKGNESWRAKVRKHHAKEKNRRDALKSLNIGSIVRLEGCKPSEFRVLSLKPLIGTASTGLEYKLQKTKITEVF